MRGDGAVMSVCGTQVTLKNCVPFTKFITKIDGTTIDDAKDFELVPSMYNLLEYCSNYFDKASSLWIYSKDEATNFVIGIASTINLKSFMYKLKLLGNTVRQPRPNNNYVILKNGFKKKKKWKSKTLFLSLKNLSNFLEMT